MNRMLRCRRYEECSRVIVRVSKYLLIMASVFPQLLITVRSHSQSSSEKLTRRFLSPPHPVHMNTSTVKLSSSRLFAQQVCSIHKLVYGLLKDRLMISSQRSVNVLNKGSVC